MITFEDLAPGYRALWRGMAITPARVATVNHTVDHILAVRDRYGAVEASVKVPWWITACIHSLEADLNFRCHLHNGDSLRARTVHVPRGRPVAGDPPFPWEDSAKDALAFDGLTSWKDWSIPGALYKLEGFNGMGYRHHGVNSPYLWSCTNRYTRGKYVADGEWDPDAVSTQVGAAAILRVLCDRKVIVPAP